MHAERRLSPVVSYVHIDQVVHEPALRAVQQPCAYGRPACMHACVFQVGNFRVHAEYV
jgi:hypothetical protein